MGKFGGRNFRIQEGVFRDPESEKNKIIITIIIIIYLYTLVFKKIHKYINN